MQRIILSLVLFIVCIPSQAQKHNDSLLVGSWKLSHSMIGNDTISLGGTEAYTFFGNKVYRYEHRGNTPGNMKRVAELGHWKIRKKQLRMDRSYPRRSGQNSIRYEIVSIGSNELVLKNAEQVNKYYYRTADTVDAPLVNGPETDSVWYYTNPDQKLYMVNANDTSEIRALDTQNGISVEFLSASDSSVETTYHGNLLSVTDSSLRISVNSVHITKKKNGFIEDTNISPDYSLGAPAWEVKTIYFKDINSISGTYGKNETTASTFGTIAGFSMFSALVVAPLASINYRNGDFNSGRYYRIAGGSLAVFAVTLPVAITTGSKYKSYNVKREGGSGRGEEWFLKRKCKDCN